MKLFKTFREETNKSLNEIQENTVEQMNRQNGLRHKDGNRINKENTS